MDLKKEENHFRVSVSEVMVMVMIMVKVNVMVTKVVSKYSVPKAEVVVTFLLWALLRFRLKNKSLNKTIPELLLFMCFFFYYQ